MRGGALVAAGIACSWLWSCGYVGDPLPPALNIPRAPQQLVVVQRGDRLAIQFLVSNRTTEETLLRRLGELDLRIGPGNGEPLDPAAWESRAQPIPVNWDHQPGLVQLEVPASAWLNQKVVIGVRVSSPKGRWSAWSDFAQLTVIPPLQPPTGIQATLVPQGVRLSWDCPQASIPVEYRILRQREGSKTVVEAGRTQTCQWDDTNVEPDVTYTYRVLVAATGPDVVAESQPGPPVEARLVDRFPPAAPAGLRAIATSEAVELSWDQNQEPDLAHYRVYRAEPGSDWRLVADQLLVPHFADQDFLPGRTYRYAVTAVDQRGNESPKSAPVEVETSASAGPASKPGASP